MPENRFAGSRLLALSLGAALVLPLAATAPAMASPTKESASSVSSSVAASPSSAESSNPVAPQTSEPASTPSAAGSAAKAIEEGLAQKSDLSAKERISLASMALDALDKDFIDATMGQGQKRIDESGDPTAPTLDELANLAQEVASDTEQNLDLALPGSLEELRTWRPPGTLGIDESHHQGTVNWKQAYNNGARFGYIKAT
ncbi:hypothetical protein ACTXIX_18090 [Glutamicibacter ardleyensis]|uniref:hypothetical protein n=1 Tax=Glutamicibacter ardleyensis TaxID=225894 RepID=UPI003FD282FC